MTTYSPNILFLGERIINQLTSYSLVVTKRPDLKTELDTYLTDNGRTDLITQ